MFCFIFSLHVVVVCTMPFQTKSDQIAKLRGNADQMRHHLKVDRMHMSKTIAELISYCNHVAPEDPLLYPVRDNPFKEKKSCAILWCAQDFFSYLYIHLWWNITGGTTYQDIMNIIILVWWWIKRPKILFKRKENITNSLDMGFENITHHYTFFSKMFLSLVK